MFEPLQHLLARLTTPLTYILWAMIIAGMVDNFIVPFLPPTAQEIGFYALWLVAAATWFGWRQRKRDEATSRR